MKKEMMILAIGTMIILSLGFASASSYYSYSSCCEKKEIGFGSYIHPSALPGKSVFYTPDNVYRAKHWVTDAQKGRVCYNTVETIKPVYSSKLDYKPINMGSYPRVVVRGNSYC